MDSTPKPKKFKYDDLRVFLRRGSFQIPQFQRELVWRLPKSARLLDSIVHGYPIGTFVLWKTDVKLAHVRNLPGFSGTLENEGMVSYIIDGQQRLATIYMAIEGCIGDKDNYNKIYLNFTRDENDELISTKMDDKSISVHKLLRDSQSEILNEYDNDEYTTIIKYRDKFINYKFSIIELPNYTLEQTVEIFTRINTTSKPLTLYEIMAAKTYDPARSFYLPDSFKLLKETLDNINFDMSPTVLLQSLSVNIIGMVGNGNILSLDSTQIISNYEKTVQSIKKAIDHLRRHCGVKTEALLPYDPLLTVFQHFFFENISNANNNQKNMLEEYFWKAVMSSRFVEGTTKKIKDDCADMKNIVNGIRPSFQNHNVKVTSEDIRKINFTSKSAKARGILCLFSSSGPKSFTDNGDIMLDNSNLSKINGRNYHHFFPKKYLKGNTKYSPDCIANITLINAQDNLEISDTKPSEYIKTYLEKNDKLMDSLSTHFVGDLSEYGITDNDYEKFLMKRSQRICDELVKKFHNTEDNKIE